MLKCCKCGKEIEIIPLHCGQDMIYNEKIKQWECWMGSDCGYLRLDEMLCSDCAKTECDDR